MAGLPAGVRALVEMSPVEDLVLALLRAGLPEVKIGSLVSDDQPFPYVLVRRGDSFGTWSGDARFVDNAYLFIDTFCEDPDGDEDAALLADAVRVVLRNAWLNQTVVPGRGHLTHVEMASSPRRVSDWATSTGPVQYADLPTGVHRYETRYHIDIRKPRTLILD